jgi:hypothetical protein
LRLIAILLGLLPAVAAERSPGVCAPCHQRQTEAFATAGMTRALVKAGADPLLRRKMTGVVGQYAFEIAAGALAVSDGRETVRVPLTWAFGQGSAGQTFLFQRDGAWYESRVSYFATLGALDLTMGAQNITPHSLEEAAGRRVPDSEAKLCFGCHATNTSAALIEGVQCERCHGSTEAHLRDVAPMRKLGTLNAEQMSDFCGQCHRTWSQVATLGPRGIQNVRFQPYRLATSKCYDAEDRRIRCTACHDPHRAVETSARVYDSRCMACHANGRQCRVATHDCVTCHMPALELPGAHRKFTDHRIRIARAGEPYPD